MSGPNTNYDPVEVATLQSEALDAAVAEAIAAFEAAATPEQLKEARLAHIGPTAPISLANREIGALPPQARKDAGQRIGQARRVIMTALTQQEQLIEAAELERVLATESIDVTLPVAQQPQGAVHPLTAIQNMMCDVFVGMGWEIADGPEVEAEWFIFDALNMGKDHPTRSLRDTFWVEPVDQRKVLRTETSNAQIRTLLSHELPVYVVSPGRVFRSDDIDASHLPVFTQIEGLCVDKGITFADLRGTLDHFAVAMFGQGTRTRVRPHYFPFTEPSAEMDVECFVCHGDSVGNTDKPCRMCKSTGWVEWGGCGMVHPRVLKSCGIDPEIYSGFAFGMGVERTLMTRNDIPDIRDIIEGDVRFSRALLGGAR
ncbi:MAG: phenylalanine--tRNA ligase subunit alpha [Propionibacteriaceae bacterium]